MKSQDIVLPSNKRFGVFFGIIFALISFIAYVYDFFQILYLSLIVSLCFFLAAYLKPEALTIFNKTWMRFGLLLNRLISPIVMGAIFYLLFTPTGLLSRLLGRDELSLLNQKKISAWKERQNGKFDEDSFKNQF